MKKGIFLVLVVAFLGCTHHQIMPENNLTETEILKNKKTPPYYVIEKDLSVQAWRQFVLSSHFSSFDQMTPKGFENFLRDFNHETKAARAWTQRRINKLKEFKLIASPKACEDISAPPFIVRYRCRLEPKLIAFIEMPASSTIMSVKEHLIIYGHWKKMMYPKMSFTEEYSWIFRKYLLPLLPKMRKDYISSEQKVLEKYVDELKTKGIIINDAIKCDHCPDFPIMISGIILNYQALVDLMLEMPDYPKLPTPCKETPFEIVCPGGVDDQNLRDFVSAPRHPYISVLF